MPRLKKQPLTEVVSMRLSERDKDLLDEVSKLTPFLPRLSLARYALRFGLMAMRDERGNAKGKALERASAGDSDG
jgi:hypothetical protein